MLTSIDLGRHIIVFIVCDLGDASTVIEEYLRVGAVMSFPDYMPVGIDLRIFIITAVTRRDLGSG